jgi:hypothetical protein
MHLKIIEQMLELQKLVDPAMTEQEMCAEMAQAMNLMLTFNHDALVKMIAEKK